MANAELNRILLTTEISIQDAIANGTMDQVYRALLTLPLTNPPDFNDLLRIAVEGYLDPQKSQRKAEFLLKSELLRIYGATPTAALLALFHDSDTFEEHHPSSCFCSFHAMKDVLCATTKEVFQARILAENYTFFMTLRADFTGLNRTALRGACYHVLRQCDEAFKLLLITYLLLIRLALNSKNFSENRVKNFINAATWKLLGVRLLKGSQFPPLKKCFAMLFDLLGKQFQPIDIEGELLNVSVFEALSVLTRRVEVVQERQHSAQELTIYQVIDCCVLKLPYTPEELQLKLNEDIFDAVLSLDLSRLRRLVLKNKSNVSLVKLGVSLLCYAASVNFDEAVLLLLQAGAHSDYICSPTSQDEFRDKSALMIASSKGYAKVVLLLCDSRFSKTNVSLRNSRGLCALDFACTQTTKDNFHVFAPIVLSLVANGGVSGNTVQASNTEDLLDYFRHLTCTDASLFLVFLGISCMFIEAECNEVDTVEVAQSCRTQFDDVTAFSRTNFAACFDLSIPLLDRKQLIFNYLKRTKAIYAVQERYNRRGAGAGRVAQKARSSKNNFVSFMDGAYDHLIKNAKPGFGASQENVKDYVEVVREIASTTKVGCLQFACSTVVHSAFYFVRFGLNYSLCVAPASGAQERLTVTAQSAGVKTLSPGQFLIQSLGQEVQGQIVFRFDKEVENSYLVAYRVFVNGEVLVTQLHLQNGKNVDLTKFVFPIRPTGEQATVHNNVFTLSAAHDGFKVLF